MSNLLEGELILRGAHHATALPSMSSRAENIILCTRWNAAYALSVNIDFSAVGPSHCDEFNNETETSS
jgi:hypothetical protein